MLTQCPHCGQTHEIDGVDPRELHPSDPSAEGTETSPPPLTFVVDGEVSSAHDEEPTVIHPDAEVAGEDVPMPIPWEARSNFLDIAAYWKTTRGILLHPARSFARWGPPQDMEGALLFLVIFGSLGQILADYWIRLFQAGGNTSTVSADGWIGFALFLLRAPFFVLISTFLSGLLTHLVLRLLGGTSQPWTKTFAFFAYITGALAILQPIPVIGLIAAPFWGLVVSVCGLRELHKTSTWRVLTAFLLPLVLFLILMVLLALFVISAGVLMVHNLPWI